MKRFFLFAFTILFSGLCAFGLLRVFAPEKSTAAPAATPAPQIEAPATPVPTAVPPTPEPEKVWTEGDTALKITEVCCCASEETRRLSGIDGDWLELYNGSSAAVQLSAWCLGDRERKPFEYTLPEITLLPGEYYVLSLAEAPFQLKPGETVYLTEKETKLYMAILLPEEAAEYTCGKNAAGETELYTYATPGAENRLAFLPGEPAPVFDMDGIYISEVCPKGDEEWIELKNGGSTAISLDGFHIGREKDKPGETALSGVIEPGGYLCVEVASLPANGCTLYLTDAKGFYRDIYETGVIKEAGMTSGRKEGGTERLFFTEPTKGAPNTAEGFAGYAPDVHYSETSLYPQEPFSLTLTAEGAEIRYTLDGSAPDEESALYTGPIEISSSTVVRAVAYQQDRLPGEASVKHYLFVEPHTVPVVCLAMAEKDFKKIYNLTERSQVNEKLCSFSYYEADGSEGVSVSCAAKAKGRGSLKFAQKSLTFSFRARYGSIHVEYPFFGPEENEGIEYRSICIRAGGQDYKRSIIRDTLINRAAHNTALDTVLTRPVAVYVNGEYLGLYILQEEMNADYYVSHYGIEKTQLDVINQNAGVRTGSVDGYSALRKLARGTKDTEESYAALCEALDVEAFTDYAAIQLIAGNTDVLNQKVVQARNGKLLFRPMLFDEDSAFGAVKTDLMYVYFKSAGFTPASSDEILCNNDVFKALYRCTAWKEKFCARTVELLNTDFSAQNLNKIIDALVEEMEPEMPRQIKKYGNHASVTVWKDCVDDLKKVIANRKSIVYSQLKSYFKLTDADIAAYEKAAEK